MEGIYLVTDEKASLGKPVLSIVSKAVEAGISCVQLREKNSDTLEFLKQAKALKKLLQPTRIPLIINDRIDIALAAEADGVHIGQRDMPYADVRKLMGKNALVGLSVEIWEDVEKAQELDVDYLGVSPVFSTPTKTDTKTPWGIKGLRKIKRFSRHPLVAIGGIDQSNAKEIINAGADSIAVVSAICSARDPLKAAIQLVRIFENSYNAQEKNHEIVS
ncbi:MAG: thiamine phosphate synthase [Desulfobacula sp.]|nr:thiamine phosphate synthase [Desulfobacula sp.]